jgi:hypothetical protein
MKASISILAFLLGGFMLTDGIFVMMNGKYIGPDLPGPWAEIFYTFDINVFKLGPLFIAVGLMWLVFLFALRTNRSFAFKLGLAMSILTLWYLPVGTLFSVVILIVLLTKRKKLGI